MILCERKSGIYLTIHLLYCVLKSFFFFLQGNRDHGLHGQEIREGKEYGVSCL